MGKKLMVLVLAATMMLGVFGLTACDNMSLADYKATKSQALQDYANAKGESNYCTDDWQVICDAVTEGKKVIENATTKAAVTTAYDDAKSIIDAIEGEGNGMFYSLDEAFENGWLTVKQLQNIAYYYYEECIAHDHAECELFAPIPKSPVAMDTETEATIKQKYLSGLIKLEYAQDATLDNITIRNYLGTYGKCIIVGITDDCALYDYLFETEHFIGGVLFRNYCGNFARVWKIN